MGFRQARCSKTVAELRGRGVAFTGEVSDQGYGLTIHFTMPGGVKAELYQPRYEKRPGLQPCCQGRRAGRRSLAMRPRDCRADPGMPSVAHA